MSGICITQHHPIKYFLIFLGILNDFNWTNLLAANQFGQYYLISSQHLPPSLTRNIFFHFYEPETSVANIMYPVVKPSSTEIANTLITFQNLFLIYEVGDDILELLLRWESLHVHDTARKQSSSLSYFNRN